MSGHRSIRRRKCADRAAGVHAIVPCAPAALPHGCVIKKINAPGPTPARCRYIPQRPPLSLRFSVGSPSPAPPAPAVTAPAAPSAPAAGLCHRSHIGRGLPDDRNIRRRRYRRYRAHERKPSCNNSSDHDRSHCVLLASPTMRTLAAPRDLINCFWLADRAARIALPGSWLFKL